MLSNVVVIGHLSWRYVIPDWKCKSLRMVSAHPLTNLMYFVLWCYVDVYWRFHNKCMFPYVCVSHLFFYATYMYVHIVLYFIGYIPHFVSCIFRVLPAYIFLFYVSLRCWHCGSFVHLNSCFSPQIGGTLLSNLYTRKTAETLKPFVFTSHIVVIIGFI